MCCEGLDEELASVDTSPTGSSGESQGPRSQVTFSTFSLSNTSSPPPHQMLPKANLSECGRVLAFTLGHPHVGRALVPSTPWLRSTFCRNHETGSSGQQEIFFSTCFDHTPGRQVSSSARLQLLLLCLLPGCHYSPAEHLAKAPPTSESPASASLCCLHSIPP